MCTKAPLHSGQKSCDVWVAASYLSPFPNTASLLDLILRPWFCPPSDTPGSHSHLKYHHTSNQSFIFPSSNLSISPNLGLLSLMVGTAAVVVSCGLGTGPALPSPTYTAHLRGWTWWQPPPPRCRPCSSSGPPAPSGCPRCAASRCRWMFPGTCLTHCPPSSSTAPAG